MQPRSHSSSAPETETGRNMAASALAPWPQALPTGPSLPTDAQLLHNLGNLGRGSRPDEQPWQYQDLHLPRTPAIGQTPAGLGWFPPAPNQSSFSFADDAFHPFSAGLGAPLLQQAAAPPLQPAPGLHMQGLPSLSSALLLEPASQPFLLPQLTQLLEGSDPDSWPPAPRPQAPPTALHQPALGGIIPLGLPPSPPSPISQDQPASSDQSASEPESPAISMQQSLPIASARARRPARGNAIVFPWPYQTAPAPSPTRRAASTPAFPSGDAPATACPAQLVPLPTGSQPQARPLQLVHQPSSSEPVGHRVRTSAVSRNYPTHEEPPRSPVTPPGPASRPHRHARTRAGQAQQRQQAAASGFAQRAAAIPASLPQSLPMEPPSWLGSDLLSSNPLEDPEFPPDFAIAPLYPPSSTP